METIIDFDANITICASVFFNESCANVLSFRCNLYNYYHFDEYFANVFFNLKSYDFFMSKLCLKLDSKNYE